MPNQTQTEKLHHYRDRQVVLYKRERSHRWWARFKLTNGKWHRITTQQYDLEKAAKYACDKFDELKYRHLFDKPEVSRRFSSIAQLAIAAMQSELDAELGKQSYTRYIGVIKMYLIPYFGNKYIDNITPADYQAFYEWIDSETGKKSNRSNITNYNVALNRIFDIAVKNGWMGATQVPALKNKGAKGERRADFSIDEYRHMGRALREWVKKDGGKEIVRQIRELLRDYVLILANTGLRPGKESNNLKWKHINWYVDKDGEKYIHLVVDGKTGKRNVIARHNVHQYLERIQSRFEDLAQYSFDDLLKAKVDEYVFRLRNGKRTTGLGQNFEQFLRENNLLENSQGQNRVLYSLRHTYATFALLRGNNISIHDLAKNMGTSIGMIEQHYSHLTTLLRADDLAGTRLIKKHKKTI